MTENIMSIHDFNEIPEGTELNYKSGGYGWWIGDEDCFGRGGRQINGSLMSNLMRLGIGMTRPKTVASHQTRFFVETKKVNVKSLESARAILVNVWRHSNVTRQCDLIDCLSDFDSFSLCSWQRPQCYWANNAPSEKAFRFMDHRWVYGRASKLRYMPEKLDRLLLTMRGRDLAEERRSQLVDTAA